jgi:hypothetical protein
VTAESGSRRFSVAQVLGVVVGLLVLVAVIGLVVGLLALGRLGDRRDLLTDRLDPATSRC